MSRVVSPVDRVKRLEELSRLDEESWTHTWQLYLQRFGSDADSSRLSHDIAFEAAPSRCASTDRLYQQSQQHYASAPP